MKIDNRNDEPQRIFKKACKWSAEILADTLKQKWSDGQCVAVNNK